MKKIITSLLFMAMAIMAHAQFEQNKWYINTSVTDLGFSYSGAEKFRMGIQGTVGAFLIDNLALIINVEGVYHERGERSAAVGAGGRYYFSQTGIFAGAGLKYKHFNYKGADNNFNDILLGIEAGYAFFLGKSVTIEPCLYYDQSFRRQNHSKVGLKLGFGYYF